LAGAPWSVAEAAAAAPDSATSAKPRASKSTADRSKFEEGVELVLDAARQLGAGAGLGVRDEAGRVLLHRR
jgi:hypothetical protein